MFRSKRKRIWLRLFLQTDPQPKVFFKKQFQFFNNSLFLFSPISKAQVKIRVAGVLLLFSLVVFLQRRSRTTFPFLEPQDRIRPYDHTPFPLPEGSLLPRLFSHPAPRPPPNPAHEKSPAFPKDAELFSMNFCYLLFYIFDIFCF